MLNNLKIAIRNFQKNKFYSLINLSGLAVGLAICFLLLLYLQHETNFDAFHKDIDRMYQVNLAVDFGGDAFETSNTPPPVGETMKNELPEVEAFTRHFMPGDVVLKKEEVFYTESNIWAVDSNFLEFFSFELLEGDSKSCLLDTRAIVLTESLAKKYFGKQAAIGKEIFLEDIPFKVTAVLADLPVQSSLQFDALYPIATSSRVNRFSWSWVWLQVDTYIKLHQTHDAVALAALEAKFPAMVRKNAANAFRRIGQPIDEFFENGNQWALSLKPLSEVHLYSAGLFSRLDTLGSIREVYIFATVGLFILLLACINFMNLATARSLKRSKEVGVRKVLGSRRFDLVKQFLVEAILQSCIAALLALALVQFTMPAFNQLIGIDLSVQQLWTLSFLAAFVGLILLTGILAGSYPAFYLSNFQPIAVLKSRVSKLKGGQDWVRNALVVLQFSVSIAIIIATIIVLQQINFTQNSDIGLNKNNVLVISNTERLGEQTKAFKEALLQLPDVVAASVSTDLPARGAFGDFYVPQADENTSGIAQDLTLYSYMVDDDFIKTLDIELVEGRDFDVQFGTDSMGVILNEAAVRTIGWDNPIGKYLTYPGNQNQGFQVIGVMKNFHIQSFRNPIEPFALFHESSKTFSPDRTFVALRLKPQKEQLVLQQTKALWSQFAPDIPVGFSFMNEDYNALYQSETRLGSVLSVFTLLSIFIACLGLFGLIAYSVEQRTKEIGIRKVLGASVVHITGLLAKDYLKLVSIAFLLAILPAWYFMNDWLNDFEYQIKMQWWVFGLAGVLAISLALITVSFQSIKAALSNPIESLRSE